MKQKSKTIFAACALMAAVLVTGCGGSGAGKSVVSGAVTYQGTPIEKGQIRFIPPASSSLPMSAAFIADGKYQLDRKGGVPEGTYKVSIEAYRLPAKFAHLANSDQVPDAKMPKEQYLPKKFNRASTLTITVDANSSSAANDFNLTN